MLDGTVRHQQTVFELKVGSCLRLPVEGLQHKISIVGMSSPQYHLQRRLYCSIVFKDIVGFRRPVDLSGGDAPTETAGEAACSAREPGKLRYVADLNKGQHSPAI